MLLLVLPEQQGQAAGSQPQRLVLPLLLVELSALQPCLLKGQR